MLDFTEYCEKYADKITNSVLENLEYGELWNKEAEYFFEQYKQDGI